MKYLPRLVGVLLVGGLVGCSSSGDNKSSASACAGVKVANVTGEATYTVEFVSTWSAATHPVNFPSDPHFSPLIGATHKEGLDLFKLGEIASDGIEFMAETGGRSKLESEIACFKVAGKVENVILATGGRTDVPVKKSVTFEINKSHSYVSLVAMLAPSPDWFVGIHDENLLDASGDWLTEKVFPLRLYDAGTDDGLTYNSANAETQPRGVITRLTSGTNDASFDDGNPPVGTFTFRLQQ